MWCTSSGSATFSAMVISGLNEEPGSWNTKPMSARLGLKSRSLTPFISMPSTFREPPDTFCRPAMARPVVDLPEPDSPTRPSTSERWMVKFAPSTALKSGCMRWPGYVMVRFLASTAIGCSRQSALRSIGLPSRSRTTSF